MLAKLTSRNQITLPEQAVKALGHPSHVEVLVEDGRLVLSPARPGGADAVRRKLAELDLTDADVADAVTWAQLGAKPGS